MLVPDWLNVLLPTSAGLLSHVEQSTRLNVHDLPEDARIDHSLDSSVVWAVA